MFNILESLVRLAADRTQVYLDALCKINNLRQKVSLKSKNKLFFTLGLVPVSGIKVQTTFNKWQMKVAHLHKTYYKSRCVYAKQIVYIMYVQCT
jgi:hypothetical protein